MRFLYPGSLCVTQRDIHFHSLRYGVDSFAQIDAIRYTFNIQFPAVNASRSWVWEPKTGRVSYEKDKDGKRHRNVGGLQESRSSADLNGLAPDSGQQAPAGLLFPCVRQADRDQIPGWMRNKCTRNKKRADSSRRSILTFTNPSPGQSRSLCRSC